MSESAAPGHDVSGDESAALKAVSTGDESIDAAVRGLAESDPGDLDAQIAAGEDVRQTLQRRLNDLEG